MPTIVAIGEALVEIMRTERDRPLDRPAEFVGPFPSGAPAIFASAAARLGASVGFVGTLGEDAFGDCVARRLRADRIDCRALRRTRERLTGIAFVSYRSDGGRSFLFHLADSAAALVGWEQLPAGYLAETRWLHITGSALSFSEEMRRACYRAAEEVHARGGSVSLDPNLRPELIPPSEIRAICEPVVRVCSVVLPSGDEAATLTGAPAPAAAAAALLARGVRLVALKRGAQGSTLYTPEGALDVPPFQVEEVDPTGAGDCYAAALLVALDEGLPLAVAGAFANAAGALATTRLGPMEGAFPREEVLAFMAAQGRPAYWV
jgi:sugar/nucleoside kinase (ribokinase family)